MVVTKELIVLMLLLLIGGTAVTYSTLRTRSMESWSNLYGLLWCITSLCAYWHVRYIDWVAAIAWFPLLVAFALYVMTWRSNKQWLPCALHCVYAGIIICPMVLTI